MNQRKVTFNFWKRKMSSENFQQQLQSVLAIVAQLQQDVANLKQDNQQLKDENQQQNEKIEKLKEEVQQLKKKDEEKQHQMEIVEVLRKEAKIEIPEDADDAAVQKILGECKFPLLTEKIDLCAREMMTDVSTGRIVAACPNVTEIDLSCRKMTDASLQHLASLRNLKSLNLAYCRQLSDAGLKHLSSLKTLTSLELFGCEWLTDESAAHLSSLENLETLNLCLCKKLRVSFLCASLLHDRQRRS
jgi:hypothetical protein